MIEIASEFDLSELANTLDLLTKAVKDLYTKVALIERKLDELPNGVITYQQEAKALP